MQIRQRVVKDASFHRVEVLPEPDISHEVERPEHCPLCHVHDGLPSQLGNESVGLCSEPGEELIES